MATYHLLPQSPNPHHHHHHPPLQQRKALSFAILILLVATATLITIIRFTVNPSLNGQTFVQPTNAFALQRAHHLSKQQQSANSNDSPPSAASSSSSVQPLHHQQESIDLRSKNPPPNIIRNVTHGNKNDLVVELMSGLQSDKQQSANRFRYAMVEDNLPVSDDHRPTVLQSSLLNNNEPVAAGTGEIVGINAAPAPPVSPASKSITSLIADQSMEREYRDDPVTSAPAVAAAAAAVKQPKPKPKVIFNEADLATTNTLTIDKMEPCGEDYGGYADLVVLVTSAVVNFDARAAIRETWGKFAVERGAFLYFMLGGTDSAPVQERVREEDGKYGDILQGSFQDHYYNLTLKTITMVRWVAEKCAKIRYVLKVDDDMMVNMQHACDFTEINPNFHRVIIGKLAKKWRPHRNPASKWYVPYSAYAANFYPNFVTGPAYFFTGDAARPLWETAINGTAVVPFYLEDVFMTGIVAEKAGIKRFNHVMMRNMHISKLNQCTFPHLMTSHKYSPQQIRYIWNMVYSGGDGQKCQTQSKISPATATRAKSKPPESPPPPPPGSKLTKEAVSADLISDKPKSLPPALSSSSSTT